MGNGASDPLASCCQANTYNLEINDMQAMRGQGQMQQINLPHLIKIQSRVKGWLQRTKFEQEKLLKGQKSTHFLVSDQRETLSSKRTLEIAMLFRENAG